MDEETTVEDDHIPFLKAGVPAEEALQRTDPAEIVAETVERFGRLDALISNDPYPAIRAPVDEADPILLQPGDFGQQSFGCRVVAGGRGLFRCLDDGSNVARFRHGFPGAA